MDSVHNDEESANPTPANKESTISERGNDGAFKDANEKSSSVQHVETSDNTKGLVAKNVHAIKGDDSDGKVPMTPKRYIAMLILFMSYVGMGSSYPVTFLGLISSDSWHSGAQLPLFFMGGSLTFIVEAVDNTAARGWTTTAYGVSLAAVTPFAGYLQDLMGRRYIAILGAVLVCTGIAVIGSAHSFVQLICGTIIAGIGAGATELASIAG
jgi:hypothetical protein